MIDRTNRMVNRRKIKSNNQMTNRLSNRLNVRLSNRMYDWMIFKWIGGGEMSSCDPLVSQRTVHWKKSGMSNVWVGNELSNADSSDCGHQMRKTKKWVPKCWSNEQNKLNSEMTNRSSNRLNNWEIISQRIAGRCQAVSRWCPNEVITERMLEWVIAWVRNEMSNADSSDWGNQMSKRKKWVPNC